MSSAAPDPELLDALLHGDRSALARAITLVESARADDRPVAQALISACLPKAGTALRIGITGIPGVGKSTLIDGLGSELIHRGHRVAVLAVDPSSDRSHGSILGDKTRMERLGANEAAFIRPTPAAGLLGGVALRTRETIVLCEAAGYDRVLIETVGIGQSEAHVDRMTDLNVLLLLGGAGDDLQGIKRGIMESADVLVLTKSDGDNVARNERAAADLRNALQLLPPRDSGRRARVLLVSAMQGNGMNDLVDHLHSLLEADRASGYSVQRRKEQQGWWLSDAIKSTLERTFHADATVSAALRTVENAVLAGELDPLTAADRIVALFRTTSAPPPSA